MTILHNFLYTIIATSTPLVLAALGGMMTRQVGMFNIGLEGLMTIGAFFGVYFADYTGSVLGGILLAVVFTVIISLFMAFLSIRLHADIFVVGIAVNIFATGLTTFLGLLWTGMQGTMLFKTAPRLKSISIPVLRSIPVIGDFLNNHTALDYLSIAIVIFMAYLFKRSVYARHAIAVGMNAEVSKANGISPKKYRYLAYLWCGVLCGLSGAAMSLPIGMFSSGSVGLTNGRGWTAMAIVILAAGKPSVALIAAWALGAISAMGDILQSVSNFPPRLVMALPFIVALIATAVYSSLHRNAGAAEAGH